MPDPLDLGLKSSARHYVEPIIDFINNSKRCALYRLLKEQGYGHSEKELERYIAEHENDLVAFREAWDVTIQRYKRRVGYANKEELLDGKELETYKWNRERMALVGYSIPTNSSLKELTQRRKEIADSGFLSEKEIIELDEYFYGEYVLGKAQGNHGLYIDGAAHAALKRLGVETDVALNYQSKKDTAYQPFQGVLPHNSQGNGIKAPTANELWQFLGRDGGHTQRYLAPYYNQGQVLSLESVKAILAARPEINKEQLQECIEADYDDYRYYLAERHAERMVKSRYYRDSEDKKSNMRAWEYVFDTEGEVYKYLATYVNAERLRNLTTVTETGAYVLGKAALARLLCDYRLQNKIDRNVLADLIKVRFKTYRDEHVYINKDNKVDVKITPEGEVLFLINRPHPTVSKKEHLGAVQSLLTASWLPEHLRQKIGRRFYLEHVFPQRDGVDFQRRMQEIGVTLGIYAPQYKHVNALPADDQPAAQAAYIASSLRVLREKAYEEPLMDVLSSMQKGGSDKTKLLEKGAVNYFKAILRSPKELKFFIGEANLPQDEEELQAWYDEVWELLKLRADDQYAFNPIQRVMTFFRDKTQDSPELAEYRRGAFNAFRAKGKEGLKSFLGQAVPDFEDVKRFHAEVVSALESAQSKDVKMILDMKERKHPCYLLYNAYTKDIAYIARYQKACDDFADGIASSKSASEILGSYLESEQLEAANGNGDAQTKVRFASTVKASSSAEQKKAKREQSHKPLLKPQTQDYATPTERSFRERYQREGQKVTVHSSGR